MSKSKAAGKAALAPVGTALYGAAIWAAPHARDITKGVAIGLGTRYVDTKLPYGLTCESVQDFVTEVIGATRGIVARPLSRWFVFGVSATMLMLGTQMILFLGNIIGYAIALAATVVVLIIMYWFGGSVSRVCKPWMPSITAFLLQECRLIVWSITCATMVGAYGEWWHVMALSIVPLLPNIETNIKTNIKTYLRIKYGFDGNAVRISVLACCITEAVMLHNDIGRYADGKLALDTMMYKHISMCCTKILTCMWVWFKTLEWKEQIPLMIGLNHVITAKWFGLSYGIGCRRTDTGSVLVTPNPEPVDQTSWSDITTNVAAKMSKSIRAAKSYEQIVESKDFHEVVICFRMVIVGALLACPFYKFGPEALLITLLWAYQALYTFEKPPALSPGTKNMIAYVSSNGFAQVPHLMSVGAKFSVFAGRTFDDVRSLFGADVRIAERADQEVEFVLTADEMNAVFAFGDFIKPLLKIEEAEIEKISRALIEIRSATLSSPVFFVSCLIKMKKNCIRHPERRQKEMPEMICRALCATIIKFGPGWFFSQPGDDFINFIDEE